MHILPRRDFVLGATAASLSTLVSAATQPLSWSGSGTRTRRGLNILQPFGWVVAAQGEYAVHPYANGGSFDSIMPAERRDTIRKTGFDFVRMTVDFGPLLSAVDRSIRSRLMAEVLAGVDSYISSGLHVLLTNFGAADLTMWPTLTDGIAGTGFRRMVQVWEELAPLVAQRTNPAQVAVELYNEPPITTEIKTDPWQAQQKYLFDRVRALLPEHTIVVTSDSFSAIDRLVMLDPADYDANTWFKFTGYEPLVFSHQGEGYWKNVHRLTFPPQAHPGGKAKAIKDFEAAVNADRSLWFFEKERKIANFTRRGLDHGLDTYFDRPCDANYIAARIKIVVDWAARHGISPRRLIIGELGARGDYEEVVADNSRALIEGAAPASQARFCESWRVQSEQVQVAAWCAHEIGGPAGWNLALGEPPWTFRTDLMAALGIGG